MKSSTSEPARNIREILRADALAAGFDVARFTSASLPPGAGEKLRAFVEAGHYGTMEWMARNVEKRANPAVLWPEAKSILMLGVNYGPDEPAEMLTGDHALSVYARGTDYHDIIRKKLKAFAGEMIRRFGGDAKVFVDTAPVMEKDLAEQAGIGWQGKHTNVVSREFGSWLFLAAIYTTLEIPPDSPERNHCGGCHACLDICPTGALYAPGKMDARRCLAYLTNEHHGQIPMEFRRAMGGRIYGCDSCLAACPWNKFAKPSAEAAFAMREMYKAMTLLDYALLDDESFRTLFRKSPIKRIGRARFIRNVLIAIANVGGAEHIAVCERHTRDESAEVRGAAVWALLSLAPERFAAMKPEAMAAEEDPEVRAEWLRESPVTGAEIRRS